MTDVNAWIKKHLADGHYCDECLAVKLEASVKIEMLRKALR